MTKHKYTSLQAFEQALEQRLRPLSTSGSLVACERQFVVFDRCERA